MRVRCSSLFQSQHPALNLFVPKIQLICHSFPKVKGKVKSQNLFDPKFWGFSRFANQIPSRKNLDLVHSQRSLCYPGEMICLKFHKSHVYFISIQGQLNSHLPGKDGAHFVTVQNNSVLKDAERVTLCFLNITRVSSSRIWVY